MLLSCLMTPAYSSHLATRYTSGFISAGGTSKKKFPLLHSCVFSCPISSSFCSTGYFISLWGIVSFSSYLVCVLLENTCWLLQTHCIVSMVSVRSKSMCQTKVLLDKRDMSQFANIPPQHTSVTFLDTGFVDIASVTVLYSWGVPMPECGVFQIRNWDQICKQVYATVWWIPFAVKSSNCMPFGCWF